MLVCKKYCFFLIDVNFKSILLIDRNGCKIVEKVSSRRGAIKEMNIHLRAQFRLKGIRVIFNIVKRVLCAPPPWVGRRIKSFLNNINLPIRYMVNSLLFHYSFSRNSTAKTCVRIIYWSFAVCLIHTKFHRCDPHSVNVFRQRRACTRRLFNASWNPYNLWAGDRLACRRCMTD